MSTEETPAFVFPKNLRDVVLRLTIKVEAGEDDRLVLSGTMTPGNLTWEHQDIEVFFLRVNAGLRLGVYEFEADEAGFIYVSGPEGIEIDETVNLVNSFMPLVGLHYSHFVLALETFPTQEVIIKAARQMVRDLHQGSLLRNLFEITPVADARTVNVVGVKCTHCAISVNQFVDRLLGVPDAVEHVVLKMGDLKSVVKNHDGVPVVTVGYLSHKNVFAEFMNGVLAERIREAIQAVTLEVVTETLVRIEVGRRQVGRMRDSLLATYAIEPTMIPTLADAYEAEARAESVPSTEEDGDGTVVIDDDCGDQVVEEESTLTPG